jgi:hypothetical protein
MLINQPAKRLNAQNIIVLQIPEKINENLKGEREKVP